MRRFDNKSSLDFLSKMYTYNNINFFFLFILPSRELIFFSHKNKNANPTRGRVCVCLLCGDLYFFYLFFFRAQLSLLLFHKLYHLNISLLYFRRVLSVSRIYITHTPYDRRITNRRTCLVFSFNLSNLRRLYIIRTRNISYIEIHRTYIYVNVL